MGNAPIYVLTLLVEHCVGKVVVLIDDEVERVLVLFRFIVDEGKFVNRCCSTSYFFDKVVGVIVFINVDETVKLLLSGKTFLSKIN